MKHQSEINDETRSFLFISFLDKKQRSGRYLHQTMRIRWNKTEISGDIFSFHLLLSKYTENGNATYKVLPAR